MIKVELKAFYLNYVHYAIFKQKYWSGIQNDLGGYFKIFKVCKKILDSLHIENVKILAFRKHLKIFAPF